MLSSDFSFLCVSKHYSNIKSEQPIHFLHNPFFIHPATQNNTPLLDEVKQRLHAASSLPWFHSTSIFQCSYFYFVPDCFAIYFQCVILFKQITIKQLDRILWNHLEIDTVFYSCIDHGFRYNSLLEFFKRYSRNYQKVILLDLKMFNYVVGFLFFCNNNSKFISKA